MADLKVIPNPDPEVLQQVEGKVVAGFDDSMIRSTVAKNVVPKLRKAGAARVDLVIGADMYSGTCDLGVDTPNRADLIAARHNGNIEAMREETGADNLIFITRQDMHDVVGDNVCDSCLGGERPAPIPIIEIDEDLKERIAARNAGRVLVGASA
jgi:amidophosphoribosyltransferase